jgi:hypothetical protein
LGTLVVAQTQKNRLSELLVRGPFLEGDLGDKLWREKNRALLTRRVH